MKEFIIASNNKGKIREIKQILGTMVYSLSDLGIDIEIEENGSTFEENALIKARAIYQMVGRPVIADDSGLEVDYLGGEPGVYSARYSGVHGDDSANNIKLLKALDGVDDRRARFVSAVAFVGECEFTVRGETKGEILLEEQGCEGFGYDPLFYSYELEKSFGVASAEEKNSVSHRAKAIGKLKEELKRRSIIE